MSSYGHATKSRAWSMLGRSGGVVMAFSEMLLICRNIFRKMREACEGTGRPMPAQAFESQFLTQSEAASGALGAGKAA
jgi:hypothetical protein